MLSKMFTRYYCIFIVFFVSSAHSTIYLDRTRVIYNESDNSVVLSISNQHAERPYLAQAWVENEKGVKVEDGILSLPPIQRIEPGEKSQVRIKINKDKLKLPQHKESLFYFILRGIPQKTNNSSLGFQLALQTKIKLFYRPAGVIFNNKDEPWQKSISILKKGQRLIIKNPTKYYVTLADITSSVSEKTLDGFSPLMISPESDMDIHVKNINALNQFNVIYLNDSGARNKLLFTCQEGTCLFSKK
ncbi:molecular chaperone [Enterobacteriaceae bacterium LUAb1]